MKFLEEKNINNQHFLGYQTMVELYGCDRDLINDEKIVERILLELTDVAKLTVVNSLIHHFSPIGVSGVIVIEESHVAIHTWPEHNYVAIDFFTCNDKYDINQGIEFLKEKFKAGRVEVKEVSRGSMQKIENLKEDMKIDQLLELKTGSSFDFQDESWEVIESYLYNWDDGSTVEYKIKSGNREAFLEIEEDEDDIYILNFSVEISKEDIDPVISLEDLSGEVVLSELFYSAMTYFLEDIDEGEFVDVSGLDNSLHFTNFAFYNDDQFVNIVLWDDDTIECSSGYEVNIDKFTNIKLK